jgi:hypothetical protein
MFTAVNILPVGAPIDEVHSCELSALSDEQTADKGKGLTVEGWRDVRSGEWLPAPVVEKI